MQVVERAADGTVVGVSGRTLKLGAWADAAEEIRVGARHCSVEKSTARAHAVQLGRTLFS